MKIVITNTVVLNGGDAAILHALISVLKENFGGNTQFVVYDNQPVIAKKYYPELEFRKLIYLNVIGLLPSIRGIRYIRRLKLLLFYLSAWCWCHHLRFVARLMVTKQELQDIALYDSADLVVSTGGTYLVEHYSLVPRIFDYRICLLMKKPLVFFTQSLGPFREKENRIALRKIFNKAIAILLRDEMSLGHLMDLDIDMQKVHVYPDVAFALAKKETSNRNIPEKFHKTLPRTVAISVRDWSCFKTVSNATGMDTYKTTIRDAITHLIEKYNADITFISTCQGIPEYWTDDSRVALDICRDLPEGIQKRITINRDFHTPTELMELLSGFDVVIATRMHVAILSLVAGTPVFPIAYEFKTRELFKRLGLDEWIQDIETLEPHAFSEKLDSFLLQLPDISEVVFPKITTERKQAFDAGKHIKQEYRRLLSCNTP